MSLTGDTFHIISRITANRIYYKLKATLSIPFVLLLLSKSFNRIFNKEKCWRTSATLKLPLVVLFSGFIGSIVSEFSTWEIVKKLFEPWIWIPVVAGLKLLPKYWRKCRRTSPKSSVGLDIEFIRAAIQITRLYELSPPFY